MFGEEFGERMGHRPSTTPRERSWTGLWTSLRNVSYLGSGTRPSGKGYWPSSVMVAGDSAVAQARGLISGEVPGELLKRVRMTVLVRHRGN